MPGGRFGSLSTEIKVNLIKDEERRDRATALLQHLMNAQKFAHKADFGRARKEINEALSIDKNFARAVSMNGAIYFMEKNYQESLVWYEKALTLDPQMDDVLEMVAHLREKLGEQQ